MGSGQEGPGGAVVPAVMGPSVIKALLPSLILSIETEPRA